MYVGLLDRLSLPEDADLLSYVKDHAEKIRRFDIDVFRRTGYFEDGEKLTFENRFWNIPGTKFPREDSPFNLASRLDDIVSDKNYWDKK